MLVHIAWPPGPHQAALLPLSIGQGEEILQKVHGLRKGQADDLPVTFNSKSDLNWGNYFNLLPVINGVG